eukprot:CAMPEP_0174376514 /NCGR_PEP_ID=MMETSP0811_2-20130205/118439_1 /TAXON_ID=73025 ORGANISM="Eutreptiella gymnastica-like, Strain CCMP1594" /NCGR_SAMPLE_ID=MMETSP0811_2 /ASSEMBLY_ACC=CAM_ASM_000667 /LENGTH=30 /DNA_ID= /DNA_START= /DNA_END= /DNA_ORIENTATION=
MFTNAASAYPIHCKRHGRVIADAMQRRNTG